LLAALALAACSPTPTPTNADAAGSGGVQSGSNGTGGTGGIGGLGGASAASDAASSRVGDAPSDMPRDLAPSVDLFGAADSRGLHDAFGDQPITGLDGPGTPTVDSASESRPFAEPTNYYVATTGSDTAAGTLDFPFRTIQHCATLAGPGDKCLIRAGTYRETVTPARSGTSSAHIGFAAYQGECVTVNGADVLNVAWTKTQGSIYVANTSIGFIQLFANGKMLNEARWPNADPDDLVHMPLAQAGPNTTATTLEGPTLPAGNWTGAYVFSIPGARWTSYTRKIESYDPASKIATWSAPLRESTPLPALAPRARDTYYVFGSLLALDSAGEWFLDQTAGKLYLWAPGGADPSTLKIEVKQRDYGFNLGARSYIDVQGLRLFATSVRMVGASHCVVDDVHARYVSHLRETNGYATGTETDTWTPTSAGLVVNISNPGNSPVWVGVHGANGDTDANQRWCAVLKTFAEPVLIPWESFNTACWNNSGSFYAKQPLRDVVVSVSGNDKTATPFNFCVHGIAPKLALGEGSVIEEPTWVVLPGGLVANADWQGYLWSSFGGAGTTLTPADRSAVAPGTVLCASGSVAATADFSGYVQIGLNVNQRLFAGTAPVFFGDFDEWKNGSIAFSGVSGIQAAGENGKITNNIVHDVGTMAVGNGGIAIQNGNHSPAVNEVSNNTVSRTASPGITIFADPSARVLHNRVSQAMQINDDGGLIYSWGTSGTTAEIAYNDVSGISCIYGTGIYLDDGSSGFVVHHNLVRDVSYWGISLKKPNQFFNNTILGTSLGAATIYRDNNTTWVDLSSAVFANNMIEQRPGLYFSVIQQQTTDAADYQRIIPVTTEWQKITVPFSSLAQPSWGVRENFDPANVTQLQWVVGTLGTYEIDIDDVWLEGAAPKLLDDFEAAGTNRLGGAWWGSGGLGSTGIRTTVVGFTGSGQALTGTGVKEGFAALGTFLAPGQGPVDLSAYTAFSFRVRGTTTLVLSNGSATTTPVQAHNLDCPVDASGRPTTTCPVDQGGLFSPYTDGFSGAAPDVGAFESGQTPWIAGATTVEPATLCPE
jgi:hypothetical protein